MGILKDCYYVVYNTLYGSMACDKNDRVVRFLRPGHAAKWMVDRGLNQEVYKIKPMAFKITIKKERNI